jgi:hypothetical protein
MIKDIKLKVQKLWTDHSHCIISAVVGFIIGAIFF